MVSFIRHSLWKLRILNALEIPYSVEFRINMFRLQALECYDHIFTLLYGGFRHNALESVLLSLDILLRLWMSNGWVISCNKKVNMI